MKKRFATAFAPASVGNVAVGFDLLGHALDAPGDRVTLSCGDTPGVRVVSVYGCTDALPLASESNTAGRAVSALAESAGVATGLEITIEKGIPLASGLGGSAASAVAAVVAATELLELDPARERLYPFALAGEAVASGTAHGDNVGCQLLGGLVMVTAERLVRIPVPRGLTAVTVHPDFQVATREARRCLADPFTLQTVIAQSANLGQVLAGCYRDDFELIAAGLKDVMIEPRRAGLIPGFARVRQAALDHGALGASISGAGPTVFGWFRDADQAGPGARAMVEAFAASGLAAEARISPVDAPGAYITETG